ncbi:MAG: glycosyltransferase family 4 protein [Mucilaginibacter sp.]
MAPNRDVMGKNVTLHTLQTFGGTGGIQKMTRTLAHSLHSLAQQHHWDFNLWSVYDSDSDLLTPYLPAKNFRGFGRNRLGFVINSVFSARKSDTVILSHINLAIAGLLIKTINPKCKVWLIAHGIEVWRPLSIIKRHFLRRCDKVVCVSNFTRQQIIERHKINTDRCAVLNNAIDPFLKLPVTFQKPEYLLKRYQLTEDTPVIFTLTRLSSTEQHKGYDQVIMVMRELKSKFPGIKYMLSGAYDQEEKIRIEKLIKATGTENTVILTGFIDEAETTDHFLLADLFVLPSKKEGFGLVFIEAAACGLPVICGDADGSTDAILNGILGTAVNVDDNVELEKAITGYLTAPLTIKQRQELQKECLTHFNENLYMDKLEKMLSQ